MRVDLDGVEATSYHIMTFEDGGWQGINVSWESMRHGIRKGVMVALTVTLA